MSSFFGLETLIENLSNIGGTGDASREKQRKDAMHDYQEHERIGIQARTEGAKAAGLHPLAAIGFQAGPSPAIPVGSQVAPFTRSTPVNEGLEAAQVRLMNAQADEAEANARRAQYALATQPGNGPPNMSQAAVLPTEKENTTGGNYLPGIKVVPNEIQASAKGTTIGTHPGGTDVKIPGGLTIRMPSKQLSESAEDLELLKYYAIAAMNKDRMASFLVDDIPWALKGYNSDLKDWNTRWKSKARNAFKPRREGGATGSW